MLVPISLPELGADPVRLSLWYASIGDEVYEGDRLVEVLTDGISFDVSAPVSGRLAQMLAYPDDLLTPEQILGYIETPEISKET